MAKVQLIQGDCVEEMAKMEKSSIFAIVTDPPYGLIFMGKGWDTLGHGNAQQAWHALWAVQAFRVLKPGGHLLAFGGTRTVHRLTCAIEDAGFEIRDTLTWIHGQGFPKNHDVSKALDKMAGRLGERKSTGELMPGHSEGRNRTFGTNGEIYGEAKDAKAYITTPATEEAKQWQGWGTALKPAHEPIVMARKPLAEKNVARQVLETGTGAINVDGCRIGTTKRVPTSAAKAHPGFEGKAFAMKARTGSEGGLDANVGRWPPNLLLSHDEGCQLLTTGECVEGCPVRQMGEVAMFFPGFKYQPKAPRRERNAGLAKAPLGMPQSNVHPTVKPIALMRWLVRLITPPGGTVLDPFAGSGSTGCAAILEGFEFVGIEREEEYVEIARRRVEYWCRYTTQERLF